jgi:hypothetical protein
MATSRNARISADAAKAKATTARKRPPRRTSAAPKPKPKLPPTPKGNTRALRNGSRTKHPENLPDFDKAVEEMQEALINCTHIRREHMPLVELFTMELHAYKYTAAILAASTPTALLKKHAAVKHQIRRAKVLGELADKLALTPTAGAKMGLNVAKTEAVRVEPVRTVERSKLVAELLQRSHALPPAEADVVVEAEVVEADANTRSNAAPVEPTLLRQVKEAQQ